MKPVPNYLMLIILFVAKWTRDFSRLFLRVKEAHIMDHASWKAWRPPLESYQDAPHWGALDPFILIKRQPQMTATRHHLQGREGKKMDETSVQVENWILHLLILFSTFWEQSNDKCLQNSSMGLPLFFGASTSIWHFFKSLFQPVGIYQFNFQCKSSQNRLFL